MWLQNICGSIIVDVCHCGCLCCHFMSVDKIILFISLTIWLIKFYSSPDRVKPDYKIGICCFSAKHAALRRKSKDLLARNQDNVSKWCDMSFCWLLFPFVRTIQKSNQGCWSSIKSDLVVISLKITLFSPWYGWKIAELALSNNHSLILIRIASVEYMACVLATSVVDRGLELRSGQTKDYKLVYFAVSHISMQY